MVDKAFVTQVSIGNLQIEGLMDGSGNYYVAVPQLVKLNLLGDGDNQDRHRNANRSLKRMMGEGFKSVQLKTEFNKDTTSAVTLPGFEKVLTRLDRLGNKPAQELRDDMVGLSLHQLFSDAFGVKFEETDRQDWLRHRQVHLKGYQPKFTSWGKVDGLTESKDYAARMRRLKAQLDLPQESIDTYSPEDIDRLNKGEYGYDLLRKAGLSHEAAINSVRP